jgi:hypothetical protein
MKVTNALTYYGKELTTAVKSLIKFAPVVELLNPSLIHSGKAEPIIKV